MAARIELRGFAGEIPKTPPHYLPDTHAVSSEGAALDRGSLTAFRQSVERHETPAVAETVYLHGGDWLSWATDADAVPGPVATDRLYVTRAGAAPVMRIDGAEVPLELPNPTVRPTVAITGTVNAAEAVYVAYAWTWVTSLGEESAPSPLSPPILWSDGVIVTVGGMPSGFPTNRFITGKRIYRSETSVTGATELFFVAEVPAANVSYVHNPATAPNQEPIATDGFGPVPDNLQGLTAMPNGIMAGFRGKEIWFCEPFQPHAWPLKYVLTTNDFIVGLAAFGSSLAVLTTGLPYVVQGLHPEAMSMDKIEGGLPCVAKRSIVDMGYAAIYASPDGLVQINSSGAQLISQALWTSADWAKMQPLNIRAARYGQRYAFLYLPQGEITRKLALVDTTGAQPFLVRAADTGRSLFTHPQTGDLYILEAAGRKVLRFDPDTGAVGTYAWKSKPFRTLDSQTFGAVQVDAEGDGGVLLTIIYADGVEKHRSNVRNKPFRLPDGAAKSWQIELRGNAEVIRVRLARTLQELAE
ncbi:hypothetical protein [Paracoccus sp. SY]|uniref:hypothetical protein n=1 Tax=Paracoccus sp. SY TaxID=1330255 RepID=UPI000CD0C71B|nr:hypothetical protein [Paracoccus sp. SY]